MMIKKLTRPYLSFLVIPALVWLGCSEPRFRVRSPPGEHVDAFRQSSVPKVDVLWVVDNSASMEEEQEALGKNFSHFYQYLDSTGADFHIGVISTDVYNPDHQGKLLGEPDYIITRTTLNASEVFSKNVKVGTDGKGDEQGLRASMLALTEPLISGDNKDFLRQDAHLFTIFVSDEDDRSFGEVSYFLRRFEQIKGIGNDGMINIGAVVGDVPQVPEWCETQKNVEPGLRYAELAEKSGGLVLSICSDDFASNLDQLGFAAAGLKRVFCLTHPAIPESLEVWIKTRCSDPLMPIAVCEKNYDDCGGSDSTLYGQTCVVRESDTDGWTYEPLTNCLRFMGAAVPNFASVIEVGYIPQEEGY